MNSIAPANDKGERRRGSAWRMVHQASRQASDRGSWRTARDERLELVLVEGRTQQHLRERESGSAGRQWAIHWTNRVRRALHLVALFALLQSLRAHTDSKERDRVSENASRMRCWPQHAKPNANLSDLLQQSEHIALGAHVRHLCPASEQTTLSVNAQRSNRSGMTHRESSELRVEYGVQQVDRQVPPVHTVTQESVTGLGGRRQSA